MAAATRAITPTHSGPFTTNGKLTPDRTFRATSPKAGNNPNLLAAAVPNVGRAPSSPRSFKSAEMSPRTSPQPAIAESAEMRTSAGGNSLTSTTDPSLSDVSASALKAARAASKIAGPLAAAVKSAVQLDNGSGSNTHTSPTSSIASINNTTAPTTTASAVDPALPGQIDGLSAPEESGMARAAVDPGLPGGNPEARAFTFPPPPGSDAFQTPGRNMSMPNAGMSGSPKTGSGAKRHKCPFCDTECTRHHNLKSHLLTHSQEKPYECTQCQSRFRRLHDLKRHNKLHTGERPHECHQCGRRFARGDALARHTKGPGGCAGRRASFGGGEDDGTNQGDSMDGVEYTAEPENMDEDEVKGHVGSEPVAKRMRHDSYRQNQSYPGPGVAPMYPPARSRDASISSQGPLSSIQHFNAGQNVFQPGGVTESPKPISPGHPADTRASLPRPPLGAGSGRGSSPLGLHAGGPSTPGAPGPTLPAPIGFAAHPPHQPGSGSHAGSISSHTTGSGASTREILGAPGQPDVWAVVRELEARLNQTEVKYQSQIASLNAEIAELKKTNAPVGKPEASATAKSSA
jgi:hypothetical protein